jgi:hypothetical protein
MNPSRATKYFDELALCNRLEHRAVPNIAGINATDSPQQKKKRPDRTCLPGLKV